MENYQRKTNSKLRQETNEQVEQIMPDDASYSEKIRKCPACGWNVSDSADICENCGEWLLKGRCNFCYAEIFPGQKFCSECGNPPEGIICSSCGEKSHFDICPHCNIPLTEQASETMMQIENSVEFQNLLHRNDISANYRDPDKSQSPNKEHDISNDNSHETTEKKLPSKSTFTLNIKQEVNLGENLKLLEQSRQKIEEEEKKIEEKKRKEEDALKLLEEVRNKTFSNNQEARRFYGALKILLPKIIEKQVPAGWLCNAYGCTHTDGPQGCADPSMGGTWIYTLTQEKSFVETEI